MKFTLPNLKLGQRVEAKIIEVIGEKAVVANFRGDLLRIANQTGRPMKPGQVINLEITALRPLKFKLAEPRGFQRFDVSV